MNLFNTNTMQASKKLSAKRRNNLQLKNQISAYAFLIPAIVIFAMFKYLPIIMGFFVTFFDYNIVSPPGNFIGLANYVKVFQDERFYTAVWNTIEFLLVSLIVDFWPPILIAILVNEVRRGKTFFRMVYFVPAIAPTIAMVVLWKYVWQPDYGLANYLFSMFNIKEQMWLNDPNLAKWCIRLPQFFMSGGLSFMIYLASLQEIPTEEIEAAQIDGANFLQKIRYIVMPHLKPIILLMLVLQVIDMFNYFDDPIVMTNGGPIGSTETLVIYAFKAAYSSGKYAYGITLSTITFVLTLAFTILQQVLTKNKGD